jgi:hypothetical protein
VEDGMARETKTVRKFVSITNISGSKAAIDRIRAIDAERQKELKQDQVEASKAVRAEKAAKEASATKPKRIRTPGSASPLTVQSRPAREDQPIIPSLDTRGFAGVPLPLLTKAERRAINALNHSVIEDVKPKRKIKKKKKINKQYSSSDILDSPLMYEGSYGMGKKSRGY